MGLANKGSRKISVNGRDYRWVVSPDSGYNVLVVERASEPGQRLEAIFDYATCDFADPRFRITPKIVRDVIEHAIIEGWQPEVRGLPPFRLSDTRGICDV